MAKQTVNLGTAANSGTGDPLRTAFDKLNDNFDEVYGNNFVTHDMLNDNIVDYDEIATRFKGEVSITTYTGKIDFDFSLGSIFKLGGDLTGQIVITPINYKAGQVISIYPVKGDEIVGLDAGTASPVFYKLGGVDYDGTVDNMIQIECVDDDAADPVFFYSITTFAQDNLDI